jgi:hypothetical protein
MGATTWNYFVPYEADTEGALQRLRQQVFRDGKYGSGIPAPKEMKAAFEQLIAQSPNPELARQQMEQAMAQMEQLRHLMPPEQTKPDTIEELLEQRAESGTHSILDIQRISSVPDFGAVCPMASEDLQNLFATDKPTRKLVAERWQGIYFTVYRDGMPDELFFMGTSGD